MNQNNTRIWLTKNFSNISHSVARSLVRILCFHESDSVIGFPSDSCYWQCKWMGEIDKILLRTISEKYSFVLRCVSPTHRALSNLIDKNIELVPMIELAIVEWLNNSECGRHQVGKPVILQAKWTNTNHFELFLFVSAVRTHKSPLGKKSKIQDKAI